VHGLKRAKTKKKKFPREQALTMLLAMNMLDDMLITNYPTKFDHSSF